MQHILRNFLSTFFAVYRKNSRKQSQKVLRVLQNKSQLFRKEATTVRAANNVCVLCLPNYNVGKKRPMPDAEARNSANLARMQNMA